MGGVKVRSLCVSLRQSNRKRQGLINPIINMKTVNPMKRNYRRIILAVLVAACLPALAQEYRFVVWTGSGGRISYPLSERPNVAHSDGIITVSTTTAAVEYPRTDVSKFTLAYEDGGTVRAENIPAVDKGDFTRHGDTVELSGFDAGTAVSVFTVDGQTVISNSVREDGTLTLDLSHLGSGIYLVTTGSITHKIIKR